MARSTKKPEVVAEMSQGGWSGRGRLDQLVAELERQKDSKIDVVLDGRSFAVKAVSVEGGKNHLVITPVTPAAGEFLDKAGARVNDHALHQLGNRCAPGVPEKFLKNLVEERPLRAAELATGLLHDEGGKHLVRMLDGRVRAMLSDRYRVIDHYDVAFTALEVAKASNANVFECSLSDDRMRLKLTTTEIWETLNVTRQQETGKWYSGGLGNQDFLSRVAARTQGELPGGPDAVYPVVTIGNSETGHGGFNVRIGILAGICFNLATIEEVATRIHLGERLDVGVLSAEAITADTRAILLKVRDGIRAAFDPKKFKAIVARCRKANEEEVAQPTSAVANLVANAEVDEDHKASILEHFLKDYRPTRYGLAQAVARAAQDVEDPDQAASLEELSGKLIDEPKLLAAV